MLLLNCVFILFYFQHPNIECSPIIPLENASSEEPVIITFKQIMESQGNNRHLVNPPNYITNFCYRTLGSNFDIPLNFTLLRYTEGSNDIVKHVLISISNATSNVLHDVGTIIPREKCILQPTEQITKNSTPSPTPYISITTHDSPGFIDLLPDVWGEEEESSENTRMPEHTGNSLSYAAPLTERCTDESAMVMEQRLRANARNFHQHISFNERLMYIMYIDGFPLVCDVIKLDDRPVTSRYDYRCACTQTDERFRRYNARLSREDPPSHVQEFVNNMLRTGQYINPIIGPNSGDE